MSITGKQLLLRSRRMNLIVTLLNLLITFISQNAGGEPGDLSQEKCNQYYNIRKSSVPSHGFAGGRNAKPKELPFMAALGYEDSDSKQYLCGGSLISEYFVITAAHCIYSRAWGEIKYIRLGDLNLTDPQGDANAQEFQLKKHYIHPQYTISKRYHDVALIELNGRVVFSDYVKPVCLDASDNLEWRTFFAAGWGLLGFGEDRSSYLQVGELQFYSLEDCQKTFRIDSSIPEGINEDIQLCAGAVDHIADTCEGDSGGPLAYKTFPGRVYYLAGITSFGKACALAKIPAVYTKVSAYLEWIEGIVWPINKDRIVFPDELKSFYDY